ncbi:RNA polymerase sigma factor [Actinomadura kijaniata]|uniref:RNA polymerase sigma factor n=1 Tax=Actinomadura kijaniata TaxID=46161 RepID=UPI000A073865|nr:RNA polymerase sigma factor [Actinomadura kijaniata]
MPVTHPPPARPPDGTVDATGPTDAAVIERSRAEPELFSLIFDRYHARIHRYAAARLGMAAAEDITADTFLAAFDQRHRYDPAHPEARAWLYGIATRLISRHRRAEVRFYRAMRRAGSQDADPGHADRVVDRMAAAQLHPEIARGLARLSGNDRAALTLVAFAQLSYAEAAVALGVPSGTVASRVNRARRKLRTALEALNDE